MLSAKEIIREAESLPVEDRATIVDCLLRTLNPPDSDVDRKWTKVAQRRLEELRFGRIKPVPGDAVFDRVRELFVE